MQADAAVIGSGPAGCAAAIRLAQAGARVVCYRGKESRPKPGEIVDATIRIPLGELCLLDEFNSLNSLILAGNLSIWGDGTPQESEGILNPYGYGVLIDRARFEKWLLCTAEKVGVEIFVGGRDLAVCRYNTGWQIRSPAAHTTVNSPVVIEATGRSRGVLGCPTRESTDNLVALLTYGSIPAHPADQRLLIEATANGWWYAAPLPDYKAVIAFLTDADLLPASFEGRKTFRANELGRTTLIRSFAEKFRPTGRACGYPANGSIRRHINGSNWVAIGDAAATYDPLSGQGVAAALAKGAAIARLVTSGSELSRGLGMYADAERTAFATFLKRQRETYRRAATRFQSTFWARRMPGNGLR